MERKPNVGVVCVVALAQLATRTAIVRILISWTAELRLAIADPPNVLPSCFEPQSDLGNIILHARYENHARQTAAQVTDSH
jgi:hypothetical protein